MLAREPDEQPLYWSVPERKRVVAEHNELYRRAVYYDVVFNRDVSREVDFVSALYRTYNGTELGSVLDLACGPAYHARAFAAGKLRSVGLDLRAEMITFAREQAAGLDDYLTLMTGDMRAFQLPEPVDVAFTMFDGLDCLLTNDDIVRHFRAVAGNLRPNGLYVIDLTHPRACSLYNYSNFIYHGERNGCRVRIDWNTNSAIVDPLTQVINVEVRMQVDDNGNMYEFTSTAGERLLVAQELRALADLSGVLTVRDFYGDFSLSQPFDNTPAAHRMIVVLQKQHTASLAAVDERRTSYLSPKLEVRPTPLKGDFGVFAREPIEVGEIVAVWGGDAMQCAQVAGLSEREQGLALQVERDLFLVSSRPAEPADFVNHSCNPNAGIQGQIVLVALRPIAVDDEVCYDYAMSDSAVIQPFTCECGAPHCRHTITVDDWRRPELHERYAGYFSWYLQQQIERLHR